MMKIMMKMKTMKTIFQKMISNFAIVWEVKNVQFVAITAMTMIVTAIITMKTIIAMKIVKMTKKIEK